jgi:hypothetical protein
MTGLWISLGLVVFSMILGMLWYGPVFGKKFSWANEWQDFDALSKEEQDKAKKEAMPYYGFQAVVTLLQMLVLGRFVAMAGKVAAVEVSLWLWLGFVLPIMAGNVIWSMKSTEKRFTLLWIGLGYQFILALVAGYVYSMFA